MVRGEIGEKNNLYCVYVNTTKIKIYISIRTKAIASSYPNSSNAITSFVGWGNLVEKRQVIASGKNLYGSLKDKLICWILSIDSRKQLRSVLNYFLLNVLYLKNYFLFLFDLPLLPWGIKSYLKINKFTSDGIPGLILLPAVKDLSSNWIVSKTGKCTI